MNRVRLYVEFAGKTYDLFNGYAEAWQQSWPDPGTSDAVATLTAADEMKVIGLAQLPQSGTIPDGWNIDQVNFILDQIHNRAPRRTYRELGVVTDTAGRDMTGQDPLTEINASVDTAITHGTAYAFFVSADGYVTFVPHFSAGPTVNFYASSFYVFREYPVGGIDRGYLDVTTDFSDSFLTNQWTITRPGGTGQTASDPASVSRYGLRAQSKSIPFQSDIHSLAAAQLLVTKYATPLTRVTSLVPNMSDGDTAAAVFDLDLFEQLNVSRTPPGGAEVTQIVRVQKIELSGEAGTAPEGVVVGCRYGLAAR
jgi:hypothetical protein